MIKIIFDFETRSEIDLRTRGANVYAEHESTDVMCLVFKINDQKLRYWVPEKFRGLLGRYTGLPDTELNKIFKTADIIEAFNVAFERAVWKAVMVERLGFDDLKIEKIRCSSIRSAICALPRKLESVCEVLKLDNVKDIEGHKLMMRMCKPRRQTKKNSDTWHEKPEEFVRLLEYCANDVKAEYQLSKCLPEIKGKELEMFSLDQEINSRGIPVDKKGSKTLIALIHRMEEVYLKEFKEITNQKVLSPRQQTVYLRWLNRQGIRAVDITSDTVKQILQKENIPEDVRRTLEIRQELSKSSVAKLNAISNLACRDDRIKGSTIFHGASTGRWTGKGLQPHNMPRDSFKTEEIEEILISSDFVVELKYGSAFNTAAKCLRGMIKAPKGKTFLCADFSSIEARVLAWLTGHKQDLEALEKGKDLYVETASKIYNKPYEEITEEERFVGKIAVLSLGYQGWVTAFKEMAVGYGGNIEEEKIIEIIKAWRLSHQVVVDYWKNIEQAALKAVKEKKTYVYGKIVFGIVGDFLKCKLPSGRLLSYIYPRIRVIKDKYNRRKETLFFDGTDSFTKKWVEQSTYGGKLTENIVQGIARDILRDALLSLERNNFRTVMHVHDEVLCETADENTEQKLNTMVRLITTNSLWAEGLPLEAKGWVGKRYKK